MHSSASSGTGGQPHVVLSERPRGELIGHFYAWWRGDPLPPLPPSPNLTLQPLSDASEIARLTGLDHDEVLSRQRNGHRPYAVNVDGAHAAWGWSAWERGF